MMADTTDTIPSVAEQEADRIRRRGVRQAVELLVIGRPDLARAIVGASFVEQIKVLGLETDSW